MAWKFDDDRAIYIQIVEKFKLMIASGIYEKGSKIPSVRELSAEAGVNPNTMQKALSELERDGLITAMRTSGGYITEDEEAIKSTKKDLSDRKISNFLSDMKLLGYDSKDVINLLNNHDTEAEQ